MEASDFSLVVDNQYYNFSMQTTGSGEFYPYRDVKKRMIPSVKWAEFSIIQEQSSIQGRILLYASYPSFRNNPFLLVFSRSMIVLIYIRRTFHVLEEMSRIICNDIISEKHVLKSV